MRGCMPQRENSEECTCGHQRRGHCRIDGVHRDPEPCLNCHCEGFTPKTPRKRR